MRIDTNVTDLTEILKLVPIEVGIAKKENQRFSMPIKDKLEWIMCMVNHEPMILKYEFRVLIVYNDEDQVIGYAIASLTVSKIKYFNQLKVYRIWYDHHYPEAIKMLDDEAKRWAKENKVHVMTSEADRRLKAWKRKWKFEPVSVNMERRL